MKAFAAHLMRPISFLSVPNPLYRKQHNTIEMRTFAIADVRHRCEPLATQRAQRSYGFIPFPS